VSGDFLNIQRIGAVTWVNAEKRNGRIRADDGEELWFHHADVTDRTFDSMAVGDRVHFVWRGHVVHRGMHVAAEVTRL
jgi:cold shock CspA family protein